MNHLRFPGMIPQVEACIQSTSLSFSYPPGGQAPQHEANQKEDDHRQKPHPGTNLLGDTP